MLLQKGSYAYTHHCEGQIPAQTSVPQICPTVLSCVHLLWPCDLEKGAVAVKISAVKGDLGVRSVALPSQKGGKLAGTKCISMH